MTEKTSDSVRPKRLTSIDAMRGLVMVVMALDHCRDFFGDVRINCEDPVTTTWTFYLTRWVTHFCAPTFVFLAGISAWLFGERSQSKSKLSWFLFTRGCWLLVLEFTVIYFALSLSTIMPWVFLVLSAIGVSMIGLSLLCRLPTQVVLAIGLGICLGHNLLDPIQANQCGRLSWLWHLIHQPGYIPEWRLEVGYPVLAWFGVMCVGYGIGPLFRSSAEKRIVVLRIAGLACIVGFLVLRVFNGYGCPQHWTVHHHPTALVNEPSSSEPADGRELAGSVSSDEQSGQRVDASKTAFAFFRTRKYPPSLSYMLMTLGPALIGLSLLERITETNRFKQFLLVFGRVPLFFYVLHFYLIHLASIAVYWVVRGVPLSAFQEIYQQSPEHPLPPEFGFSTLWQVYVAHICVILLLFYPCRFYSRMKRSSSSRIWSYL